MNKTNKKVYLPKKVPKIMLKYVERSEGLKFKRKPHLVAKSDKYAAGTNWVERDREGKKVTKVHSATVGLSPTICSNRKKLTQHGKVTLLHELRENIHYQNKVEPSKTVHRQAAIHRKEDEKYARKH